MNTKIDKLKQYCQEKDDIILAFLFGSSAKGMAGKDSDLDFGVYLKDKKKEDEIWREISRIAGQEVDLVLLNDAPATLISNIFKTGIPLSVKDRKLYWDLHLSQTLEAEDFAEFTKDYWKIYSKSKSLLPEDKARLLERVQFLENEFKEIEGFKKLTFQEYRDNKTKRRNVERWCENIINATIDIAKIILASEKKKMPKTYQESLFEFGLFIGLNEKEAERLSTFARLRNILAHEYLNILYKRIQNFIAESPPLYQKLFKFLSVYPS